MQNYIPTYWIGNYGTTYWRHSETHSWHAHASINSEQLIISTETINILHGKSHACLARDTVPAFSLSKRPSWRCSLQIHFLLQRRKDVLVIMKSYWIKTLKTEHAHTHARTYPRYLARTRRGGWRGRGIQMAPENTCSMLTRFRLLWRSREGEGECG